MDSAPFRIVLGQTKRRPQLLSRSVSEPCLSGAVLCACQWLVWSNAPGRGKLPKYQVYRVETREADGSWRVSAEGTLKDARLVWTEEDDARIESAPDVRPLIEVRGTTRHGWARSLKGEGRPKSRLALLVQEKLNKK